MDPVADLLAFIDAAPTPYHAVAEAAETGRHLDRALATLDPAWRRLVLLCDVEGFSVEELSEMEGIPAGTVKSRLHRARTALRKSLAGTL